MGIKKEKLSPKEGKTSKSKSSKSKSKKKRNNPIIQCRLACCESLYDEYIRPLFAEFLGSVILVFLSTLSFATGSVLTIAVAHGFTFAFLSAAFGPISDGHFNPSITLGVLFAGGFPIVLGILYICTQIVGAIGGAALTRGVLNFVTYDSINGGNTELTATTSLVEGFVTEGVITFILVTTYLVLFLDYHTPQGPIAIGLVLLIDVIIAFNITGASANPARSLGSAVIRSIDDTAHWAEHWVYWVGPIIGIALAVIVYRFVLADPEHRTMCRDEEDSDVEPEDDADK